MASTIPRAAVKVPLSAKLPPIIFGTSTFNSLFNKDPYALGTDDLVAYALSRGIRAFDTSPYYGPSEELLGKALDAPAVRAAYRRDEIFVLTKCGRNGPLEFDYSPAWVRQSVERSLRRLRTDYLDVVYCHDVEFVTPEETLAAVRELRRLRDQHGTVRHVGISGYPVARLCELAEMVRDATGEPLDAVMSYANLTLQNATLTAGEDAGKSGGGVARLRAAGVDIVPNASLLGMGLLRRHGIPAGAMGDWHPAPPDLRAAIRRASDRLDALGDRIEDVAIRHSVETWATAGAALGARGHPAADVPWSPPSDAGHQGGDEEEEGEVPSSRLGVSVMGVSTRQELDDTLRVWHSILDALPEQHSVRLLRRDAAGHNASRDASLRRQVEVRERAAEVAGILGSWYGYRWASPDEAYVQAQDAKKAAAAAKDGSEGTVQG